MSAVGDERWLWIAPGSAPSPLTPVLDAFGVSLMAFVAFEVDVRVASSFSILSFRPSRLTPYRPLVLRGSGSDFRLSLISQPLLLVLLHRHVFQVPEGTVEE